MRYFGGKVGLLEALFEAAWDDLNRRVARVAAKPESARATILGVIDTVVTALARDPEQATLFLFEARRIRGGSPRVRSSSGFTAFSDSVKTDRAPGHGDKRAQSESGCNGGDGGGSRSGGIDAAGAA